MKRILKIILLFPLFIGCTPATSSSSSEKEINIIDPKTISLEEYKNVSFSWLGLTEKREPIDISNVEIKNKREPLNNEIEVKVYLYDYDTEVIANYQYLIEGEDYSGRGEYHLDFSFGDEENFTGAGATRNLIGIYTDSTFENLIPIEQFISVSDELKEIHVRTALERSIYRFIDNGVYIKDDVKLTIKNMAGEFTIKENKYKLIANENGSFTLYVNDELIDKDRYDGSFSTWGLTNLYRISYLSLYLDNQIIFPFTVLTSITPYSCFAYL